MTTQQEYILHTTDTTRIFNTDNSFEWPHQQLPNNPDTKSGPNMNSGHFYYPLSLAGAKTQHTYF